jgi:hypothetical protein
MSDPMAASAAAPAAQRNDYLHRLTARLASLDLDPPTIEILTAVLTADLDPAVERPIPLETSTS